MNVIFYPFPLQIRFWLKQSYFIFQITVTLWVLSLTSKVNPQVFWCDKPCLGECSEDILVLREETNELGDANTSIIVGIPLIDYLKCLFFYLLERRGSLISHCVQGGECGFQKNDKFILGNDLTFVEIIEIEDHFCLLLQS